MVLGDLILDEYLWGRVTRISPEAPIPVVDVQKITFAPGGAANVAANIAALGGEVIILGIIGGDEPGKRLKDSLEQRGIDTRLFVDEQRPTTFKSRIIAHSQQIVRVDRESNDPISAKLARTLLKAASKEIQSVDAVLISDYGKGVTTPSLMRGIVSLSNDNHRKLLVDPKGADYSKYKGVTIITP